MSEDIIEVTPPANDNTAAPSPSQRIARIAVRLYLLGAFLLVIGVPVAMAYTYFIDAWAVRGMMGAALVGGMCLLISGIIIAIIKKPH